VEAPSKCGYELLAVIERSAAQNSNHRHRRLLRARRERPGGCRADDERDELAALHHCNHSITSPHLPFAERDLWNVTPRPPGQSALMPVNFTTLLHFSVSSAMSLPKSTGEPRSAVAPHSASRAFILGSVRPALISMLSLSTISAGVFFGAPTPLQKLDSS